MTLYRLTFSTLFVLLLVGCGGGENGDSAPTSTTVPAPNSTPTPTPYTTYTSSEMTGLFLDSPVSGLSYVCSFYDSYGLEKTEHGTTTAQGNFTCNKNSSINFFITDETNSTILDLGYTKIAPIITPLDLSEFKDSRDEVLMNVLQLLQTLDKDKNTSNGIDIDFTKTKKLDGKYISFSQNNFDKEIANYLEENLTTPENAYAHFNKSLKEQSIPEITIDYSSPIFTTPTSITLYENIKKVIDINATDDNTLVYHIENSYSAFEVNKDSGELSFKSYGDYENKSRYSVTVSANDGVNISYQTISINLLNVNDNAPTIAGPITSTIYENSTNITQYTISDADDDNITISLSNNLFDYNASTKYLFFKSAPDYESGVHSYNLKLTASDSLHSTTHNVTINIKNRDDVVPVINTFSTSIYENVPLETVVGTVGISTSGDSNITNFYLLGTGSQQFKIDKNGVITTNAKIDYETLTNHRYDLEVKAVNKAGDSDLKMLSITVQDVLEKNIPTLVVVMNWTNYSESSASLWHDKLFNKSANSAARWYQETSLGELDLVPVNETSGTRNDGVIMINMGVAHPGGYDDINFRDTYITNAITNSEVVDSVDFAALDTNANGDLDVSEIQIIFIVAGGEESYGDDVAHSIWAHAWSFDSGSTLSVDGVTLMKYNGDRETSGSYSRFGANHGDHSATIGVICHELGHAMLNLRDFYDDGGGSGLGWYDVMSGGAWAQQDSDTYAGATPTQFSTYNKSLSGFDMNTTQVSSSTTKTLKCSSNDDIKLTTSKADEYFIIECRDTSKVNSDISMNNSSNGGVNPQDNDSFTNRLFTLIYHVDDNKTNNLEDGIQTSSNHYNIAILEKDTSYLMTSKEYIDADYNDVYIQGDVIDTTRTKLYDGSATGYRIEIISEDYTNKTMTVQITK